MKENLFEIIKDFSREKGLDHEVVIKLVEESLIQAAQRKLPYREIEGHINEDTGKINLVHFKEVDIFLFSFRFILVFVPVIF